MKQSIMQNAIQTVPAVPLCKYTGTLQDDDGMLELNAYKRCVSFVDLPMYTLPTSIADHNSRMIILDRHGRSPQEVSKAKFGGCPVWELPSKVHSDS